MTDEAAAPPAEVIQLREPGDDTEEIDARGPLDWLEAEISTAMARGDLLEAERLIKDLRSRTMSTQQIPTVGVDEIFAPLAPLEWVVEGLEILSGAVTLIAGYGHAGKTAAVQSMGLEVAAGLPIWGDLECDPGRVIHVDYEQGKRLTYDRWQRMGRALHVDVDKLRAGDMLRTVSYPEARLTDDMRNSWCRLCEGAKLCVIDSFRAAAPHIDENDSKARLPLDMMSGISEETGCAIIVLTHGRKSQQGQPGGVKESIRGSSGLFDAAQSVLVLVGDKGEPTIVHHEKARVTGRIAESFALEIVDIPNGADDRWGLLVRKSEIDELQQRALKKKESELLKAVIGYIRRKPMCTGKMIRANVTGRNDKKDAAIDELLEQGKIVNHGTESRPKWRAHNETL